MTTQNSTPDGVKSPHILVPTPIDTSTLQVAHCKQVKPTKGPVITTGLFPLSEIIDDIRTSDRLCLATEQARAIIAEHGRGDKYDEHKLTLPGFLPSSAAPIGTRTKGLKAQLHTGMYGFDLDEPRPVPIEEMREALRDAPGVVAYGVSLGADGMWCIVAGPLADSEELHKAHWTAIARQLPDLAKATSSAQSKNSNRFRAMAYDPDAWLAETVTPLPGATPEELAKSGRRRERKAKAQTADPANLSLLTDRETTLLADLAVPQEYNEWLSWLTTLKASGFTLEQVEGWSGQGQGYQPGEVGDKWETLPVDPPTEARARFRKATGGGLLPLIEPGYSNMTDAANFHRLIHNDAGRLVIALPGPADGPDAQADIYGVDSRGILSRAEFEAAVLRTGRCYLASSYGIGDPAEFRQVASHARKMRDAGYPERLRQVAAGALAEQREFDALPPELVVKDRYDIDADLSVIGTPGGVLNLRTGKILPPSEARQRFVVSTTGVDYNPIAQHEKVDEILPPPKDLKDDTAEFYRARILAHGMLNAPAREFLWEVCARGSGKSSFVNALRQGLGTDYVETIRREALMLPKYNNGSASHSGDLRHFKAPHRFVFALEVRAGLDSDLLKGVSGGDRVDMRRIHREDESFQPTGHLWIMGNPRSGRDTPSLGIAEDSEDAAAILDRAKMLERPTIPEEMQDKTVVLLNSPEFKAAALARVVEYAKVFGGAGFPDTIPTFAHLAEQQRDREIPTWHRDWLPKVLIPLGEGETAREADNRQIYEDFEAWFEEFGEGRLPSKPAVGKAVREFYQVEPAETRVPDQTAFTSRWIKAYVYRGFKLNAD